MAQPLAQPVIDELHNSARRLATEAAAHKLQEKAHRRAAAHARRELDRLRLVCTQHGIQIEGTAKGAQPR